MASFLLSSASEDIDFDRENLMVIWYPAGAIPCGKDTVTPRISPITSFELLIITDKIMAFLIGSRIKGNRRIYRVSIWNNQKKIVRAALRRQFWGKKRIFNLAAKLSTKWNSVIEIIHSSISLKAYFSRRSCPRSGADALTLILEWVHLRHLQQHCHFRRLELPHHWA